MSDIIVTKESFDFVQEVLDRAKVFHLENEVVFWALQSLKQEPGLSIEESLVRGMDEWDVCFVKRTPYRVILEITEDWEKEILEKMFDHTRMEVLESGKVVSYLNDQEYNLQMSRPDSLWVCPITKLAGVWDDTWFEQEMEKYQEREEEKDTSSLAELRGVDIDPTGYFNLLSLPRVTTFDHCQTLGMLVHRNKEGVTTLEDYDRFLQACKKVVESDIFQGVFALHEMDLVARDYKRGVYVNKDGSRAIMKPGDEEDKSISKKEDIQYRGMLLFYFKSKISKKELEERFDDYFCLEGELPKKW